MTTLSTSSLAKRFGGVHAVDHVSVSFLPGQITGLIGPNGSGKSTFINLVTGMIPNDTGHVVLDQKVHVDRVYPSDIPTYGMTRTFQEVRLFEELSVLDNLLLMLTERDVFGSFFERHGALHEAEVLRGLERVGLTEKKHAKVRTLSYGQRKLIEIARVLLMESRGVSIFFFDEPYAGLFPEMVKIVSSILKELRSKGYTVVLVEHNMDLIRELSDTVIVFDAGKVLAEGKPEHVLAQKDVIEAYLGM